MRLRNVKRLEEYWHNFVLTAVPLAKEIDGAALACYPEVPMYPANHAADIKVNKDETEGLLNKVTQHFSSLSICLLSTFTANSSAILQFSS